eukprot:g4605.t1
MVPRMMDVGQAHNIQFSYGGDIGNTFESHRLLWFARKKGREAQDRLVEELFKLYFEQEKSLGEQNTLLDAARSANFNVSDIESFLASDEGRRETLQEIRQGSRICSGVPFFIFDEKFAVSGAQDKETFLNIFEKVQQSKM